MSVTVFLVLISVSQLIGLLALWIRILLSPEFAALGSGRARTYAALPAVLLMAIQACLVVFMWTTLQDAPETVSPTLVALALALPASAGVILFISISNAICDRRDAVRNSAG